MKRLARALPLLFACLFFTAAAYAQKTGPEVLSYAELETLYDQEALPPPVADRLDRLLNTPFVDNTISAGSPVKLKRSEPLGEILRVAQWNIERGIEYEAIEAALSGDEAKLARLLDPKKFPAGSKKRREVLQQARALSAADVTPSWMSCTWKSRSAGEVSAPRRSSSPPAPVATSVYSPCA